MAPRRWALAGVEMPTSRLPALLQGFGKPRRLPRSAPASPRTAGSAGRSAGRSGWRWRGRACAGRNRPCRNQRRGRYSRCVVLMRWGGQGRGRWRAVGHPGVLEGVAEVPCGAARHPSIPRTANPCRSSCSSVWNPARRRSLFLDSRGFVQGDDFLAELHLLVRLVRAGFLTDCRSDRNRSSRGGMKINHRVAENHPSRGRFSVFSPASRSRCAPAPGAGTGGCGVRAGLRTGCVPRR